MALGPFAEPPELKLGEPVRRTLMVYNDTFTGESVAVAWDATVDGSTIAEGQRDLEIPLGYHTESEIEFTPTVVGELHLNLSSSKGGEMQFEDSRKFAVVEDR